MPEAGDEHCPIIPVLLESFGSFRVRLESYHLHGIRNFIVSHKVVPAEASAEVLRHHDADSQINAELIFSKPVGLRLKSINESIARPGLFPICFPDGQ